MDIRGFVKKEYLLVISAVLAVLSLFLVPFETVLTYDYMRILRTICTLLFFLLIVAGLKECKALKKLAQLSVKRIGTSFMLCAVLIFLPFFCAMLFSNDVSLLTFVPLAIAILKFADMRNAMAPVMILQTLAANVGSYLTPFGNPHNLYIFNMMDDYGFTLWEYESALIPIVIAGAAVILALMMVLPKRKLEVREIKPVEMEHTGCLYVILALFILSVITVFGLIPFYITLAVVVIAFVIMMPQIFPKVDYSILLIFFFLFMFANGLTNMENVHAVLSDLMSNDPMLTTVIVSQFTSNVPSTILLQPFTDNWAAVLVGADIGGFGTPIASMASIITLKFYMEEEDQSVRRYLGIFLMFNIIMLAALIPTYYLFG